MNPRTQECFGLYGYGIGYFAEETQRAARGHGDKPSFCDTCPKQRECWGEHKARVERAAPIETAAFIAAMDQARAGGDAQAGGRMAARLAASGTPDPWMAAMLANLQRGIADRA